MSVEATTRFRINRKANLIQVCGGKCQICGYNRCNRALEFHHIDPTLKSYALAAAGNCHNIRADLDEVRKCLLVCANCHREIEEGLYKGIDLYTFQYFDENYAQELINKVDEQLSPTPRVCSVCGAPITKYSTSGKCSNCVRLNPNKPSREVLKEEIYTMSFEAIGRKYNLSGSAIKKWCKTYNLPAKKTDINKYTREEWDKI